MRVLFGSIFHVRQLLLIIFTQQSFVLHQQIYDETSAHKKKKKKISFEIGLLLISLWVLGSAFLLMFQLDT